MRKLAAVVVAFAVLAATPALFAAKKGGSGGAASAKAVFSTNLDGITFTKFETEDEFGVPVVCDPLTGFDEPSDKLCTPWVILFDIPDAIKTSTQGALEAVVSTECSLWTDSSAIVDVFGTGAGGSRAGIELRVYVDGELMEPGNVVYCDRLQYIELTIPELDLAGVPVTVTGDWIVRLFQRTKNAHSFHFYKATPATSLHHILVEARGIVQCFKDGDNVACVDSPIDIPSLVDGNGDIGGGTKAAIGKATLVVEEHNNWRICDPDPLEGCD